MPSAVPLTPGWQSRPKDAAIGLFDRAGCPACWCAAEASESYLVSVAQETCRDASVWRDLVAARGMCPAHTRRLSGKPAAANSLTVGYFNVMRAALGDVAARPAACPGCEITDAATHHLLRYLLVDATRGTASRTSSTAGCACPTYVRRQPCEVTSTSAGSSGS